MKQTLQEEKVALIHKKGENANQIQIYISQITGIKNRRKDKDVGIIERDELGKKMQEVHHKKQALDHQNADIIRRLGDIGKIEDQTLIGILKEILTQDQMNELYLETRRRIEGVPSVKITLFTEKENPYKKISTQLAESLLKARREMTLVFNEGCSVFDKGTFMKLVSPLNTSIPPEIEINKLRRIFNF